MSALQNTVCRKVGNPISHKIEQPQKRYKNPNAIDACQYFNNLNHAFHKHGKFILIEQINNNKNTSTELLKERLKDRENYWIKRLKTLTETTKATYFLRTVTAGTSWEICCIY